MSESSTQTPAPSSGPPSPVIRHLCILLALCGILLFWNLGALGLTEEPGSGRLVRRKPRSIGGEAGVAAELGALTGFLTPGGHLRIDAASVDRVKENRKRLSSTVTVVDGAE